MALYDTPKHGWAKDGYLYLMILNGFNSLVVAFGGTPAANVTPTYRTETISGSIPTDAIAYSVSNIGVAAGTLGGVIFPIGATDTKLPQPTGAKYNAVAFDATGTTFLITETR